MKKLMISLMAILTIGLVGIVGLAQGKDLQEHVTIRDKVLVNTTMVKPGNYLIKYDAKTGEATILDGKKVVVTVKASVTTSEKVFPSDALLVSATPSGNKLNGIRLGGQHEEIDFAEVSASN